MTVRVTLYRSGKGPFKKDEFVICPDHLKEEAAAQAGRGFILLVTQSLFDKIEAWRDTNAARG